MNYNYWEECISEAAEDCNLVLTKEQINTLASWVEGAHEQYGMAHGYDAIPNPLQTENEDLKRELRRERDKTVCPTCNGRGEEITQLPCHTAISQCFRCKGEGKV